VLLLLTSPHVLCEPLGAGARPVHPIRVTSRRRNIVVASGSEADIDGRAARMAGDADLAV
jgi:hypothetical protein